jgi:hypothetical protein
MVDVYGRDHTFVLGHSKGGNLAQYVTVVSGIDVDHCYTVDGQGFNYSFQLKYAAQIALMSGNITTLTGAADFVNILLNSISGTTVYYEAPPRGEGVHLLVGTLGSSIPCGGFPPKR